VTISSRVLTLKGEGTHPPGEAVLARFAEVRSIRSQADLAAIGGERADLVLVDTQMPALEGRAALEAVRAQYSDAVIMLVDFKQPPARLRRQLSLLASTVLPQSPRKPNIPAIVRTLRVSQEALGRILNVSGRTAHRWMKGTRPRPKPELERLTHIVMMLQETLPNADAIGSYLQHPNPSFNGDTPIHLLLRREFDRVEADLLAIREGVFI
jgi:DNA-binding NarL/FixJ family response regulator